MRAFLLGVFFWLAASVAVFAQSFSPEQMDALKARLAAFEVGIKANDHKVMTGVIPRKVWDHIKTQSKLTDAQLEEGIKAALTKAFEKVKIVDFKIDVAAATTHKLPDGMMYLMVPTSTTMEAEGVGKLLTTSSTLALIEDNSWYLMRVSDKAQIDILQVVYPAFKGVTFPEDKMQKIED